MGIRQKVGNWITSLLGRSTGTTRPKTVYELCTDGDAKCEYRDYIKELRNLYNVVNGAFKDMDPIQAEAVRRLISETGGITQLMTTHPEFEDGCAGMTDEQHDREFSRFLETYEKHKGLVSMDTITGDARGRVSVTGDSAIRPEEQP